MDREQHRNVFTGRSSGSIVQARDVHVHNTVAYPTPYQLPSDPAAFVGRSEHLEQLDDLARTNQVTARTAVIAGQPGVGKTALAVHWGHSARKQFPDGQLYIDLRGYSTTALARWEDVLQDFLRALGGPELVIPPSPDAQKGLYHSMTSERRVLVILDNAASTDQVRSLIPAGVRCLTVVTSRNALPGLVARDGARRLTLDLLSTEHAVTFLTSIIGEHHIPIAAMTQLAKLCGGLPLALRIAAEHAASPGTRIERYIQDLTDERSRLDALDFSDDDTSSAVRAIFSWSYHALSSEAAHMFRSLGVSPITDISPDAASALAGIDLSATRKALSQLANAHLVDADAGRFRIHDLLRAYAKETAETDCAEGDRKEATIRLIYWYYITANSAETMTNWLYPSVDLPNIPVDVSPLQFESPEDAAKWHLTEYGNLLTVRQSITTPDLYVVETLLSIVITFGQFRYLEHGLVGISEKKDIIIAAKDETVRAQAETIQSQVKTLETSDRIISAQEDSIDSLRRTIDCLKVIIEAQREMIEAFQIQIKTLEGTVAAQKRNIEALEAMNKILHAISANDGRSPG